MAERSRFSHDFPEKSFSDTDNDILIESDTETETDRF